MRQGSLATRTCLFTGRPMLSPSQVVDTYFLEARHQLLEIAALLDRHDAALARAGAAGNGRQAAADAAGVMGDDEGFFDAFHFVPYAAHRQAAVRFANF